MYQTFNMGIGMEVVVKSLEEAKSVITHAKKYDVQAFITGHTEKSKDDQNVVKIGESIYTK